MTKLFGCTERIAKDEPRIHALGNLDELNSWIGFCTALAGESERELQHILRSLQEDIFTIQAIVAGAPKKLHNDRLAYLEEVIADIESEIEPIHAFTIPGATVISGALDVGRTIARRTERSVVAVSDEALCTGIVPYLNRLSSALFALARLVPHRAGIKEEAPRYGLEDSGTVHAHARN